MLDRMQYLIGGTGEPCEQDGWFADTQSGDRRAPYPAAPAHALTPGRAGGREEAPRRGVGPRQLDQCTARESS